MKRIVAGAMFLVAVLVLAQLFAAHVRKTNERECVQRMKQLDGAAISYCLEQRLHPGSLITMTNLADFVRPGDTACPIGNLPYPPFSALQGPTCHNGHLYAPGVPRPFRTSYPKTIGLYRAFGLTNLIDTAGR